MADIQYIGNLRMNKEDISSIRVEQKVIRINHCIGCETEIENYPCPYCGFNKSDYHHPEHALPFEHILHGRYLTGKVLGQGGFGITYVGWDLLHQVKVAIKEYFPKGQVFRIPGQMALNWQCAAGVQPLWQNGINDFITEANKMAQIAEIPEVVKVLDTFADNNTAYIVMEFLEGETLRKKLERSGPLTWQEAKTIFFSFISAMDKVHEVGLIHRDLSPDNLILQPNGGIKIFDLGAAKDMREETSACVVKRAFSPMEQYGDIRNSGPWTDVYSVAATMYYSLTGVLPPSALNRVNEDTIRWDLPQLKAMPQRALEALKKAMAVLKKDRTQSMAEFMKQMQSLPPADHLICCPVCGEKASGDICPLCGFEYADGKQDEDLPQPIVINGRKYNVIKHSPNQSTYAYERIAWDIDSRCKVVIKIFAPDEYSIPSYDHRAYIQDADFFIQKAKILKKCQDIPEIIHYRDCFVDNKYQTFLYDRNLKEGFSVPNVYAVFDYVEGETLEDRISRLGPLSWTETKQVFFPWIEVMAKVHRCGVVCQNIDNRNVIFLPDGGIRYALNLGHNQLSLSCQNEEFPVSIPPFSCPSGDAGPEDDVYSMAETMYWALTGKIRDMQKTDTLWELSELKTVPGHVVKALQNALKLRPRERTQSMGEFLKHMQCCPVCGETISEVSCPRCGYIDAGKEIEKHGLPQLAVLKERYVVVKHIGKKDYRSNYIGWDRKAKKKVLISVFEGNRRSSPNKIHQIYLQEVENIKRTENIPELINYIDYFETQNSKNSISIYSIFEYIEGETLLQKLIREGPLSWKKARPIFVAWIVAMEKVHKQGVICKNIGKENILFLKNGQMRFALNLGEKELKDCQCEGGEGDDLWFNPNPFFPIEMYTTGDTGTWTDVYSMAAILYWTLSGKFPVSFADRWVVQKDPLDWELPQLRVLPPNVLTAMQNALKLRPKERTQSMQELLQQICTS